MKQMIADDWMNHDEWISQSFNFLSSEPGFDMILWSFIKTLPKKTLKIYCGHPPWYPMSPYHAWYLPQFGYGSIPIDTFLVGWTSIYQLFWGSLGTRVLTHPHFALSNDSTSGRLKKAIFTGRGWDRNATARRRHLAMNFSWDPVLFKLQIISQIWRFPEMGVPPKSSMLIQFSIINQQFWGKTPIYYTIQSLHCLLHIVSTLGFLKRCLYFGPRKDPMSVPFCLKLIQLRLWGCILHPRL